MTEKKQDRCGSRSVMLPALGLGIVGLGLVAGRANAANYYLDVNGATAGSGVASGGSYNWDDPIWTTIAAGDIATVNYVDGNFPRYAAAADLAGSFTLTMNTNHTCVGMIMEDGPNPTTMTLNGTGTMSIDGGTSGHDQQGFLVNTGRSLKIFNKVTGPGGISWGGGGGSLFLYGDNDYEGGTIIQTGNGLNINNDHSLSTGPINWSVATAVIAAPDALAPITLNNVVNTRTVAVAPATLASTLVVTGAQPISFTNNFNLAPGVSTTISVGNGPFPNAAMTISGPVSGSAAVLQKNGTGTLTLSNPGNSYTNGTIVNGGKLIAANADALPPTAITVNNGAVAQYQAGLPKAATMFQVATAGTGQIDLTDNSMVIRGMTDADVKGLLTTGYNAGAWNGPGGIVSSTAATSTVTSVGFASNASLGLTEFKGVSDLTETDVIVKYTYAGDANLDGKVDIGDLGLLAGAWQQLTGKVWFDGDFTYDGAVNIGDLGLLAGNWQKGTVGNPSGPLTDFNTALAQFSAFNGVVVPEPTGLALLGVAGVGLLGRGRRRQA